MISPRSAVVSRTSPICSFIHSRNGKCFRCGGPCGRKLCHRRITFKCCRAMDHRTAFCIYNQHVICDVLLEGYCKRMRCVMVSTCRSRAYEREEERFSHNLRHREEDH
uniref:Uncharacterized protein n=1 Tax=Haemonchus contortus TaxID=6289 RepID=A0A7I4XY61_HAECO